MRAATLIERREYKYLVDEYTAASIRASLQPFCALDAYGAAEPGGSYAIETIYFDTARLELFFANRRKLVDRFKLRVRHYPQAASQRVFFEVKQRNNDVISKSRGRAARDRWVALLQSRTPDLSRVDPRNRAALERFICLYHTYQVQPVTVVRYEREAYVSQIDSYARVTFDRQVRSQLKGDLSLEVAGGGWRYMDNAELQQNPRAATVVEMKFTSAVPRWMVDLVQRHELTRASFSKYGTSVIAWNRAPSVRVPHKRAVA